MDSQQTLFGLEAKKEVKKRKGEIIIKDLCENIPFAVDFNGYQEGSGSPCNNEEEVKKEIESIRKSRNDKYIINFWKDCQKRYHKGNRNNKEEPNSNNKFSL